MSKGGTEGAHAPSAVRQVDTDSEGMLVNLARLDTLLELAGEVIIVSANLDSLHRMVQNDGVPKPVADNARELAYTSSRISSDLHKLVVDVRNVGMHEMFGRFRRVVRDTARRLGKAVKFETAGEDVMLDKRIAQRIFDPIAHQLRNAVAHGIESEQARVGAGKPPVGRVSLKLEVLNTSIRITVEDDGCGVDLDRVRERVLRQELASAQELAAMDRKSLYGFLFQPGFSTAETTDDLAGRGVGMNVVKQALDELDGDVLVDSTDGLGTRVRMEMPKVSAVNIVDALMVRAGEVSFAFPLSSVLSSLAVDQRELVSVMNGTWSLRYLDSIIPVRDLLGVFGERPVHPTLEVGAERELCLLVIEHRGRRVAFIVSEFLHPQKLVITSFDGLDVPGIVGTAILAGRSLGMIVDVPELIALALDARTVEANDQNAPRPGEPALKVAPPVPQVEGPAPNGTATFASIETDETGPPQYGREGAEREAIGREYLHELDALVSKLNGSLLSLEERRDRATTDTVFRLAHSIKGNFTMCREETAASLTHDLETVLDDARPDPSRLTDETFDLLFDACTHLESVTAALLAGRSPSGPPASLRAAFSAWQARRAQSAEPAQDGTVLDRWARFMVQDRRRRGLPLHALELAFDTADPAFLASYLILRRIQTVADVLSSNPSLEALERGEGEDKLHVLVAPRDEQAELFVRLEANLREHFDVHAFEVLPPDSYLTGDGDGW
ncbi:MAG: ATP-binding protein [Myxococcales bacterium]|nr:ATP-binding protein [Myxococcales bacterium]